MPMFLRQPFENKPVHTFGAQIIFAYGMTKSGSTLAFELARSGLEIAGFEQPRLSEAALGTDRKVNFVRHLSQKMVSRLVDEVSEIGHPIVLKTHTRPDPAVIDLFHQGKARALASYRDPRELALSMLDHAARSRVKGVSAFAEYSDLDSTKPNIKSQIDSLTQWLYRPYCLPLYYGDVAFRKIPTTRRILAHIGVNEPPRKVIAFVDKHRFTQKNKALRNRHQNEMSADQSREFLHAFQPFYKRLIERRTELPTGARPALSEPMTLL